MESAGVLRLYRGIHMAGGDESLYSLNTSNQAGLLATEPAEHIDITDTAVEKAPDFAPLRRVYWNLKRPLGLSIGIVAALLALPLFLVIAVILAHRGRPVFIRRKRLGQYGQPFTSYYFRTMSPDSLRAIDPTLNTPSPATDALGRFLRKTRLDHLPLLLNVLRGDMNLVGPRPLAQEELIRSGRLARHSLSVRPGLTGLWWVHNESDPRRRLVLDRSYIERASPILDLRIALRTLIMMHGG